MTSLRFRRGDLWWVVLDPALGSEIKKKRPCVIVQRDAANAVSRTTIICPITSANGKKAGLTKVPLGAVEGGLKKASIVLCDQVRVVDARRLGSRIGRLDAATMDALDRGLRAILDL